MTEIYPNSNIYIGDINTAQDRDFFINKNIQSVINCTKDLPNYFSGVSYLRIPVNDSSSLDNNNTMELLLPKAVEFALMNSSQHGVLIHCQGGVSRSATVCAAILRYRFFRTIRESTRHLQNVRPVVFFYGTKLNFEHSLYNTFGE